jgi:nitroimidazol reductase NimA-like FMN-containing flavoprotein (pyridoxamine 5'-phosphate oxidase superfamily)
VPENTDMAPAVAQRIADRRVQLGLTEEDLARQAGMARPYLRHLLEVGVEFDPGAFLRIAAALHLTYPELLAGRRDAPPGQAGPAPRPALVRLSEAECWDRLGTRGVGRVAIPVQPGPAVFPVNYQVDDGTLVYRTAEQSAAAPEPGSGVSFQVDHVNDRLSSGWSVLVTGRAERVEEEADVQRLERADIARPWAGGVRSAWIRIRPEQITGRQVGGM